MHLSGGRAKFSFSGTYLTYVFLIHVMGIMLFHQLHKIFDRVRCDQAETWQFLFSASDLQSVNDRSLSMLYMSTRSTLSSNVD